MGNSGSASLLKTIDSGLEGGVKPSPEDVRRLFAIYDKSKDGVLQRGEAMALCHELVQLTVSKAKAKVAEAKRMLSGVPRELRAMLGGMLDISLEAVKLLESQKDDIAASYFAQADRNHDGNIQFEEFQAVIDALGHDEIQIQAPAPTQ